MLFARLIVGLAIPVLLPLSFLFGIVGFLIAVAICSVAAWGVWHDPEGF